MNFHIFTIISSPKRVYIEPREDQGVREVIPHIGPIPIIIPLKLFLEGIDFPRIMLPRALRGSW